ncbi:LrgB family protein [Amorphus orientalis]|uniref:Murein hydrolase (TIGR00659 family) n=1 Tax=Amorphus orientalis TaxID=649198 RepID=A0AAE3VMM1_9HYPH|nr:LrgB family protein [Amorphus orientalis]MDQ0314750.1 putative murein hydrolase (TIGR00659 family) [Amorphus orientalis]
MPVESLWVYLAERPLLWLTVTLAAYLAADRTAARFDYAPLVNPVVLASVLIVICLKLTGTSFPVYFEGAQFVHFLLGPATVALAVPFVENIGQVRRAIVPLVGALVAGSLVAVGSALAIGYALGLPTDILMTLAPKSVTTPIAMGIAERLGGIASLAAVLVITTGVLGAIVLTPLMRIVRVDDERAAGLAAGVCAHGIGTARAFQISSLAGTFAGLGMGLNGVLTAVTVPLLALLLT